MERLKSNAPVLLLGAALAASATTTLILTAELTFFQDTWEFLINRRDPSLDALLEPHNEHIVVLPVAIEQILIRIFGMSSATPEYVVLTLGLLATALLLFVYVRRRVGPWLALLAAVLLLFLGPAWEVLLWPFEISFVGSMLCGIGMLLCLEREDRGGDLAACLLLVLCFGFSSLGIPFAVAASVAVFQDRERLGLRRAYVVAVPLLLFAAWYLGWGHDAETHTSLRNVLAAPRFVVETVSVAVGSLFGLGTSPSDGTIEPLWGWALVVAMALAFGYRQLRKPGFSPWLWPVVAAATTNWSLAAFNQIPGRYPTSSRYQYAAAIFVLLILANLLQGVRPGRRALLLGGVVTLLAVGPNLIVLEDGRDWLQRQTLLTRSDTAAIEIARRSVDPRFQLDPEVAGTPSLVDIFAGEYLAAVDEYGSPAYSPAELASAPPEGRRQADVVLAQALPISTVTRRGGYVADGGRENCVTVEAGAEVTADPGLTRIELTPGPHADFSLRRFATGEYPVSTEGAPGGSVTVLRIPRDGVARPWWLRVDASQPARVCR
jgi:hypothetical protein